MQAVAVTAVAAVPFAFAAVAWLVGLGSHLLAAGWRCGMWAIAVAIEFVPC